MAVAISLRRWNENPSRTNNFDVVTKLTTLGNPTENKSILGYFLSVRQNTAYTRSTPNNYALTLSYRFEINESWTPLRTIENLVNTGDEGASSKSINEMLMYPINNVKQIQLRLSSPMIKGDFNINDFGLIYRNIRTTSISDHDED